MSANNLILVPIDFSEKSMLALEQAKVLAKITKSDIMMLNVIQLDNRAFSFIQSIFTEAENSKMVKKIEKGVRDKMNQIIESCEDDNIDIKGMISHGKAYEKIIEVSKSLNCNFIVIGANDAEESREKNILGTNASRIVRMSEIPVLTVNSKLMKEIKKVILPLDLTKETAQKVARAIKFAQFTNAEIKVVSALLSDDQEVKNKLNAQLNVVYRFISENYGNASAEIVYGNNENDTVAGLLMKYAIDNDGDVILIMTQQEKALFQFFLGSTAMDIVYNSSIPVLSSVPKEINKVNYR